MALFIPAKKKKKTKTVDCPNGMGKISSIITHPFDRLWCFLLNDVKNNGMENAAGIKLW